MRHEMVSTALVRISRDGDNALPLLAPKTRNGVLFAQHQRKQPEDTGWCRVDVFQLSIHGMVG